MPRWPLIVMLSALTAAAAALEGTLTPRPLGEDPACPYGYLEYLPAGYATGKKPEAVVIAFHGNGDEGDGKGDLTAKLARNGVGARIGAGNDLAAVVLCPQAPDWFAAARVHEFIAFALRRYRIDPQRILLIGHSAGGSQVWNFAHAYPELPAAIVPICGASNPANPAQPKDPAKLAALPVWAFHCFDDGVVNKRNTVRWMNGIAAAVAPGIADVLAAYPGAPEKAAATDATATIAGKKWLWSEGVIADKARPGRAFTMYRDGGHDAWTRTYANPALWEWLLAQRRPAAKR